jgi:hypothetical protein
MPDKFRIYHNLVAASALLIMICSSATDLLYTIFFIQRSATFTVMDCTLDASLDASLDYCASLNRIVLYLDSTTST